MNPGYSYNNPNVQSSINQPEHEVRKSFVDNKPMIQGLVRSVLKVEKNGEAHLINTGLTDVEGAKQIAHNLFSFYDKDRSGNIDPVKVRPANSDHANPGQHLPSVQLQLQPPERRRELVLRHLGRGPQQEDHC